MTTSKPLPARPSLESLRKQAKKLTRDIAAGHAGAIARARAQLPNVYCIEKRLAHATSVGPWKAFVMEQVSRAVLDGDLTAFVKGLQHEPWLLGDAWVGFQDGLIGSATLNDREEFIVALFELDPAILRHQPPPRS